MAEETLVTGTLAPDMIRGGKELVQDLKRNGYSLRAAFWMMTPSDPTWRLVLVSNLVGEVGRLKAYERALKWARSTPRLYWPSLVSVEEPTDPVIYGILSALAHHDGPAVGEVLLNLHTSTNEPTRLYVYET